MIAAIVLVMVQVTSATETLPIDERMAAYEAAIPELRELQARADEAIGRLGPVQPGWATSGSSAEAAIAAANGNGAEHVLGEWEVGGHGVVTPGDRPLEMPRSLQRYSVRRYDGPVDYHTYHRSSPGIVIHERHGKAGLPKSPSQCLVSLALPATITGFTAFFIAHRAMGVSCKSLTRLRASPILRPMRIRRRSS